MTVNLTLVGKGEAESASLRGTVARVDASTLRYVEDKSPDMALVSEYLRESELVNHWANFGPVSQRLEAEIARRLNLDDGLRVVMCASGTAAMHGIVNLHETLAGKRLRWVTSSFGYYSAIQGPLQNAEVVDCDGRALLDLQGLDPSMFDGCIVTNVFGQSKDLTSYYRYAAAHGKVVIIDAAMAFAAHEHGANECISFHHTKPWGFGEGGCAIVAAEHEQLFRSLICFGHEPGEEINRRALNGKISDISCAFVLMRLKQMETREAIYREQYHRIAVLGYQVGFSILGGAFYHSGIPANVPLLAPLPLEDYRTAKIPTGRYYHPLADTVFASEIYSRIVNVPCHPGIASLSDDHIKEALSALIQRCF